MEALVKLVYYDGITTFESMIRVLMIVISMHGVSSFIHSLNRGIR